jgi:TPR repeat protein
MGLDVPFFFIYNIIKEKNKENKMKFLLYKKIALLTLIILPFTAFAENGLSRNELKQLQYSANNDRNPISQYLFAKELLNAGMFKKGVLMMKMSALNKKSDDGNGYEKAQRELAEYYLEKKQYDNALAWFKKSAKSGNKKSAYVLSTIYRLGIGVEKNYSFSLAWMKYAAKSNDSEALRSLGQMYLIGFGTEKDEKLGIKYFQSSIKKNNYQSMLTLGVHYKIEKINNQEANKLITRVKEENTNFMADYIYKTNVSGELIDIQLIGNSLNSKFSNGRIRSGNQSSSAIKITNRSNLMDEKVVQYYKHLLYTFRTLEQSVNI